MRGKSLALLILALGCGLVASLGITQVLAKRGEQAAPVDTAPVFVAKADIPQGAIAGGDSLKLEQWPKDKIPPGALCKQEDVDNRRTRYKIFAGQPVLEPMLLHPGETTVDAQIPKGMRVVCIPVGPEAMNGGLVVPGARCDVQVFVRADANQGFGETLAKTILQDIRVFAVNDITNMQQQQQPAGDPKAPEAPHSIPTGKTVSLLVTPAQAEVVTLASQLGTIRLILRSGEDTEQTKLESFGASKLFSGLGRTNRDVENQRKQRDEQFDGLLKIIKTALATTAPKPRAANLIPSQPAPGNHADELAHFTMRLRNGENVNDVFLTANVGPGGLASNDSPWTATNLPTPSKTSTDPHIPIATNVAPVAAPSGGTAAKQPNDTPSPALKTNVKPPMGT